MNNQVYTEVEKALLGLILEEPKTWGKVRGLLRSSDFSDQRNQLIFEAMNTTAENGFEIIEIAGLVDWLNKNSKLGIVGGEKYFSELISFAGYEANIQVYIKEISNHSRVKKIEKTLSDSLNMIKNNKNIDIESVIEGIESKVLDATRDETVTQLRSIKEIAKEAQDEVNRKLSGEIETGLLTDFKPLDKAIGGFQKGDLIILAARPAMGKTALAINIATNVAQTGNVAVFSLEMSSVQIINRIVSSISNIEGSKIKDPKKLIVNEQKDEPAILNNKYEELSKYNFYIDDSASIKLADLVWKSKKLHKNIGLNMIVIDYLQLLNVGNRKNENRQSEVSLISRTLKQLARELEIPVVALSQLSRKVETRENKRPMMSDLRESGSIEQDADIIAFIYREMYYANDDQWKNENEQQKVEIIIAKHRAGSTNKVDLSFKPSVSRFDDGVSK